MNFETSDINLAGFLMASGCPLQSHRREAVSTIFCLEQTDELLKLVDDYFNMKAQINPLHYGSALKILKNIIYQKEYYNNDNKRMFNQSRRTN
jgi:hypothetical protein